MAATIAKACGSDRSREKYVHRLGSQSAWAQAATWRTFATVEVDREGAGHVRITRAGREFTYSFGPESKPLPGARHARMIR